METRSELMGTIYALEPSPSPTSPTALSGGRPKRRRNVGPTGDCCRICRARKVRCPGKPGDGPCANCARLELECSFLEEEAEGSRYPGKVSRTTPSRSHTEAGTLRRRAQRACQNCHIHKTKCSGELPQCKRCVANGLVCEYMPTRRNFSNVSYTKRDPDAEAETPRPVSSQDEPAWVINPTALSERPSVHDESEVEHLTAQRILLNKDVVLRHFNTWFALIHTIQCYGFFHPATTYQEIEENRLDSILGAGVCAVSGLLLPPSHETRAFTERCNLWVKFHLSRTVGMFNKQRLMSLVLSSLYDLMVGDWPKVWEYSATAARLVTALQFNWDGAGSSFIEQESIRRLTWQVFLTDRILAGGFDEHLALGTDKLFLSLPCSDQAFHENKETQTGQLDLQSGVIPSSVEPPSMRASYVRLFAVRHEILNVTKKYAMAPNPHPRTPQPELSRFMEDVDRLQSQLDIIQGSLPESMRISDANIQRYYSMPSWEAFVMLHTWIFQLHLDLYRFALPSIPEQAGTDLVRYLPSHFLATARSQAVAFAVVLCRFWETSSAFQASVGGSHQLLTADHVFPACVVESTKILLIARQHRIFFDVHAHSTVPSFHDEPFNDATIGKLIESNMAILEPFYKVMPKVRKMARDLQETITSFASHTSKATIDEHPMMGMPFSGLPEIARAPGAQHTLETLHTSQVQDDEATRRGSASMAEEYMRKKGGGFDYNDTPQGSSGGKSLSYAFAPPEVPFGLSQIRASNPGPMMISELGDTTNATPAPTQFHTMGMGNPEMADFTPTPMPQQAAMAHPQGFDPGASPEMFMTPPSNAHFNLSPHQMDILMNFNDPYTKPEPPPETYNMPYQDYRAGRGINEALNIQLNHPQGPLSTSAFYDGFVLESSSSSGIA